MLTTAKDERSYIPGRQVRPLENFKVEEYRDLNRIGISMDERAVRMLMKGSQAMDSMYAADAIQGLTTTATLGTPVQFLQSWLPGLVYIMTAARKIDDIVGIQIAGQWEDEQVVQMVLERTGYSMPYGDYTNVPLSSWNNSFNYRTVVRFEEGMKVGQLEAARSSRMGINDASAKREAAALALDIIRNSVGFSGFNAGSNNTYGLLNDPGLGAYVQVATGVAGFSWSVKTFLEICRDIRTAVAALRAQSQDTIDPEKMELTLAVATNSVDYLSTTSDFGISVRDWLKEAYPRIRVVSAPQLNAAYLSSNVFYLFADRVDDASTDGGRVFVQVVPTKFRVLGVQQLAKAYEEDFSNATAGVMCKRPYAVVRYYGI